MSEISQVMDNIKEAIANLDKNPSIYKKKIFSNLFDLLSNETYHLSDSDFFSIVRKTFTLNPTHFLKYLYKDLTDKIRKLYGDDKKRKLEKSLLDKEFIEGASISHPEYFTDWVYKDLMDKRYKLYGIWAYDDFTDKMDHKVVKEIKKSIVGKTATPSLKKKIYKNIGQQLQNFSGSEFNSLIREIFKMNPKFFLKWLYEDLMTKMNRFYGDEKRKELAEYLLKKDFIEEIFRVNPIYFLKNIYDELRQKMFNFYGLEKTKEIEKEILEKYSLFDGEQILYEFDGNISQSYGRGSKIKVNSARIFVTNKKRIIAQGKMIAKLAPPGFSINPIELILFNIFASRDRKKVRGGVKNLFAHPELPCYGISFPIINISKLKKRSYPTGGNIKYKCGIHNIKIQSPSFKKETEENIDKVYDILLKSSESLKEII